MQNQTKNSLTTLQVAAHCLYTHISLVEHAYSACSLAPETPHSHSWFSGLTNGALESSLFFGSGSSIGSSLTRMQPNIAQFYLTGVRKAVKTSADALLLRMKGAMGDILLNVLQEELRRSVGSRWSTVSSEMSKDYLTLLPPVPSVTLRMGLEYGMPLSQVECTRREVQVSRSALQCSTVQYSTSLQHNAVQYSTVQYILRYIVQTHPYLHPHNFPRQSYLLTLE